MLSTVIDIAPYLVSAGGAVAYLFAWKHRKANTDKVEIEITKYQQGIYQGIIEDLKKEMGEMKQEIFMLREVIESYRKECDACPNKKKK